MNFTIARNQVHQAMQLLSGVVEKRPSMLVVKNVLLRVGKEEISLTATDTEVQMVYTHPMQGGTQTEFCIDARILSDIVRNLPEGEQLEFDVNEGKVGICSGNDRFSLVQFDTSDEPFPTLESPSEFQSIQLHSSVLKKMLRKTSFAMANNDVRYYINSLLMEFGPESLCLVATNGHRLSKDEHRLQTTFAENRQLIIPRKGVSELSRLLGTMDCDVQLGISDSFLEVSIDNIRFSCRLVDGTYPDYRRVIPPRSDAMLYADRKELVSHLERAAAILETNADGRPVVLQLSAGRLLASCENTIKESSNAEMEVDYQGEEMRVGFNVDYLREALYAMDSERVMVNLGGDKDGCLLAPDDEDALESYVVMPLNI